MLLMVNNINRREHFNSCLNSVITCATSSALAFPFLKLRHLIFLSIRSQSKASCFASEVDVSVSVILFLILSSADSFWP